MADSLFGFSDPQSMMLLGALQGLGQYAGASRLPQTMGQAFGGAAGGMLQGIGAGQQYQKGQQEIGGEALKNFMALDAIRQRAAGLGQQMPSLQDIQSGNYQIDWKTAIDEMMKRWQAQQGGAPQIPQAGGGAAAPTPTNASQIPGGVPNLNARLARDVTSGRVTDTLTKLGYSPIDQSAVLGNAAWESSLNPANTSGDEGTSMGLWQWHAPERKVGLLQYAANTGRNWSDPSVQAEYMDQELRQRAPEFFDPNKSLAEKTKIFQDKFEVPAKDTSKERTQLAQNFAAGQASDAGGGVAAAAGGATAPAVSPSMSPRDAFAAMALSGIAGKPSQAVTDYLNAQFFPPGSAPQQIGMAAAMKGAGLDALQSVRPNGSLVGLNPANPLGPPRLLYHAPTAPEGYTYEQSAPGAPLTTVPVQGGLQAVVGSKAAAARGAATMKPETVVVPEGQPGAGTEKVLPLSTVLSSPTPFTTKLSPKAEEAQRKSGALGVEYGGLVPGGAAPGGTAPGSPGAAPEAPATEAPAQAPQAHRKQLGLDEKGQPVYGNIPNVNQQTLPASYAEAKPKPEAWTKSETEMSEMVDPSQQAEERLMTQASIYKSIESGQFREQKALLAARLSSLGINPGKVNLDNAAAVETALHENQQGTLQILKSANNRFTQKEFLELSKYNPGPNLQPATNLQLISEMVGFLRRDQAMAHDWVAAKKQGWRDPQQFEIAYQTVANPLPPIVDAVAREIGPLKGMTTGAGGAPYNPAGGAAPAGGGQGAGAVGAPTSRQTPMTATGPNGHKIVLENGRWVDAVTHQPVPAR